VYGPITDRYGRKPPLYWGLGIFTLASALCAVIPSVDAMIALRFLEAIGACAGTVVSRAMVRDLFPPEEGARVFSSLMLVMVIAPVVAPLIGSYLLLWLDWQSIFWALAIAGGLSFLSVLFRLDESHPPDASRHLALGRSLQTYGQLLLKRQYVMSVLSGAFAYGGLFAYITGSPFVFIEWFHLPSEHYGWLFAINSAGIMAASQINRRFIHRLGTLKLLRLGAYLQTAAGIALLVVALTGWGGLYAVIVPLFLYIAGLGAVSPNSTALAMAGEQQNAGAASALMGFLQFGVGTVSALAVGALHAVTPLPIAAIIAVCGLVTTFVLTAVK
jgi:DHA1 family bicyclomycin/chloramphenicol resistance-like MFS transporter